MDTFRTYTCRIATLISAFLCSYYCTAQNLVPNPSFEILTSCPFYLNTNPVLLTPPWLTPYYATNNGQYGTADVFNACSQLNPVGVPDNVKGYQYPRTGNGYAGFTSWGSGGTGPYYSAREYLQVPLKTPLIKGNIYYAGFYLNLPNRYCAIKEVGIHFSTGIVPPPGDNIFNYEPQIESNQGWLNDTVGWMLIEGCFVAEGGEEYITIGNFRHNMESALNNPCSEIHGGYYFVDDVFVINMDDLNLGEDFSLCPGDSFTLFAGGGNTSYTWQDLSDSDTFSVVMPGTYFVEATNICGTISDTIVVSPGTDPPQIVLPTILTLCQGEQILLDPQILGVDFDWSNGSHLPVLIIDTAGDYGLTITNGCGSDTEHVTILDGGNSPLVSIGNDISICPNEILEIQPNSTGAATWLWQDGSTSSSIFVSSPGVIHVTVSNACGTASDTALIVASNEPPGLELGQDIIACEGDDVLINSNTLGVSYMWQDGSTQSTISTRVPGVFILQISNFCGSAKDSIEVSFISPPPTPFLGNDTTLCIGDVHTLHWEGTEDIDIQWQNGSTFPFYFIDEPGQYSITATNQCGVNVDTIDLSFIPAPQPFSLGSDTILCPGEVIMLSILQSDGLITWQNGSHLNQITADQSQVYSATVSNQCGMQSDEMDLSIDHRNPTYPFDHKLGICPDDTINLDVTQGFEATYFWNTGSYSPNIDVTTPGKYGVTISTDCVSETFDFDVVQGVCDFIPQPFIPNVFSPNGDNINDNFFIPSFPNMDLFEIHFTVFDRWGNMVFSADQMPIEWNGQYKGSALNPGVFAYHAIFTNRVTGVQFDMTGDVTMVK